MSVTGPPRRLGLHFPLGRLCSWACPLGNAWPFASLLLNSLQAPAGLCPPRGGSLRRCLLVA